MMKKIFKSKKMIVLLILVALAGLFAIYQFSGSLKKSNPVTYDYIDFDRDAFVDYADLEKVRNKLVAEKGNYQLYFDEEMTHFSVKDTNTGVTWYSNPQEKDPANPSRSIVNEQQSIFVVNFSMKNGTTNSSKNSYDFSVLHETLDKTYKVRYLEDGVQVLYIMKKMGVDKRHFPKQISSERFEELILSHEIDSGLLRRLKLAYLIREIKEGDKIVDSYYELQNYDNLTQTLIKQLYEVFYETCGYTLEDLEKDNAEYKNEVVVDDPYYEIAVEFRLTDKGLVASVINESIVDDPRFPITSIKFLPFFGAASKNEEGYFVIPDGSGALMRFNNGKTFASSYQKRFYGKDLALLPEVKPDAREELLLPVYGIVNSSKSSAALAIVKNGAPMTSLSADISGRTDSYNKINTTFNYREQEGTLFINRGLRYNLATWTKTKVPTDFTLEYQFLSNEEANYNGIAKAYQNYLKDNHGLTIKDNTKTTVLNVNLLGMYERKEFFMGIPYSKKETLTTFNEAIKILDELKENNITNINLMYDGWFNDSIDHTIPTEIKINNSIGGKKGLNELLDYTNEHGINFYPTMNLMSTSGYEKPFDSMRYTAEHINGKVSMLNEYDLATKLRNTMQENNYIISPTYYNSLTSKMLNEYNQFAFKNIGLNDIGSKLSGDYQKNNYTFREDSLNYQLDVINQINEQYNLMMYAPFGYTIPNADIILGVPISYSKLQILDETIPFYQLILNGFIDYSGISINENNELGLNYHRLKAIETGSNINYVFSFKDSSILLETDFNHYYSTNYRNWIDSAVGLVNELDRLKINETPIESHEILANGVYKVVYTNGNAFIINYNSIPYDFDESIQVQAESYLQVGGDLSENN